jgi:hypothetical protein
MSTTGSSEVTRPSSSPLATFTLEAGSVGLTIDFVTEAGGVFGTNVVVVVVGGSVVDEPGDVVVVLSCVEVVEASATLAWWRAAGVVLELVSVKTSTSRRRGLDHISRWAPRRVNRGVVMVLEG